MDKIDYKKLQKEYYQPGRNPERIYVPKMTFLAVSGKGDPNEESGEYSRAVELLYSLSYTMKMGLKSGNKPEGYADYTVPPLEGFWWMDEPPERGYPDKSKFQWLSVIRQPEFITEQIFSEASDRLRRKKPELNLAPAELITLEEGDCVQVTHIGPFDDEGPTVERMEAFIEEQGLKNDIGAISPDGRIRMHHEIYISDFRRTAPEKLRTVIRIPVREG